MLGFLGDLLGLNNGQADIDAANKNRSVISGYGTTANGLIDTGAQQAGGYLGQVNELYSPLAQLGQKAGVMYGNSLGLNGPSGNLAALSAYQQSPGYQNTMDQGLQALGRTAASRGMLGSGNTSADTLNFATGLANNDFGNWQSQLGSTGTSIGSALGSQTTALDNLASLATGTASAKTGVAGEVASGNMGANNQQAAGETADTEGLSNLFGNIVGGGLSFATGGLSGLANYAGKAATGKSNATGNGSYWGYGGF